MVEKDAACSRCFRVADPKKGSADLVFDRIMDLKPLKRGEARFMDIASSLCESRGGSGGTRQWECFTA